MEKIRSEQAVAASPVAAPTPIDIVASVGGMRTTLVDLFSSPGLPEVVVESRAACDKLFTDMEAAAQKLAEFEATIRAAMSATAEAKPQEEGGEAAAADTRPAAGEGGAERTGETAVAEGTGGEGAATNRWTGSSSSKAHHPPPPKLKPVIKTVGAPKAKTTTQRVAAVSIDALLAGRNWANISEEEPTE